MVASQDIKIGNTPPPTNTFPRSSSGKHIVIPTTLENWPWQRTISPHYEQCKVESTAWFAKFGAFSAKAQKAFDHCDFSLLAALAYPTLNKDGMRVGCDLMNVFFTFDEWSDVSDEFETRLQADSMMEALRNPHKPRPLGEWVGGEVTRQFWANAIKSFTPIAQKRFIDSVQRYTDAVVQQSFDRTHDYVRDVKSYFAVRRGTAGVKPVIVVNQSQFNLPDHVVDHPIIRRLEEITTDLVIVSNDMYSYNVEQSRGDDGHNLVTVVMRQYGLNLQEAFDWIGDLHQDLENSFLANFKKLPHFPLESDTINKELHEYACALGNWVRANDQWSFESPRYFGADGLRIFNERVFTLLPKQCEARNWKLVVTIYIALMVAFSRFFPQLRRYLGMAEKAKKG